MYKNESDSFLALRGLCDVHKTTGHSPNYFDGQHWLCLQCWIQLGRPAADKYTEVTPRATQSKAPEV